MRCEGLYSLDQLKLEGGEKVPVALESTPRVKKKQRESHPSS